uniref:hypothetical protein n=1 Tax=uncultured Halomonas sp. TaxID=173971 RepID=UPI002624A539
VLDRAQEDATALITPTPPVIDPPKPPDGGSGGTGKGPSKRVVRQERRHGLTRQQARQLFAELEAQLSDSEELDVDFTISRREGRDA